MGTVSPSQLRASSGSRRSTTSAARRVTGPRTTGRTPRFFLVSGRGGHWRAVEPLGITINGDQQVEYRDATFVRRADGSGAIDVHESIFDGGNGWQSETDSLFTFQRGKLERVETIDHSPACNEQ